MPPHISPGRAALLIALALAGCDKPLKTDHFTQTAPRFDPIAFWTGHHTSWGVVENASGAPTDTVRTDCLGTLQPDGSLRMAQTLTLGDGTVTHRDWHMWRDSPTQYGATANDMVDEAHGSAAGRVFHWTWTLALSPGNALKNITMDQWMYFYPGGTMMNRTTIRKFGFVVAEVAEQFEPAP